MNLKDDMPIKMWTCGLTAPSQHCSHNYTCYYKQVAPVLLPSPQDTPLHAHDLALSRNLSPGSLTKRQGLYVDCPIIHPVMCLSELSYLFSLQGPEPRTAMYRQLHTAVHGGGRAPPLPSPLQQHDTVHQEAVPSRALSGRQVAL